MRNIYLTDEYITKNPSLHKEDSLWKVSKIIPLVDKFIETVNKSEINLLDVGGGAGLILSAISAHIENNYDMNVNKFALDLSPGILEVQKKKNPDLKKALSENILNTSLSDKEIDLTLMIDVLEHVNNPLKALRVIKRISNFVIFKVPLEDNLINKIWNFVKGNKLKQNSIEKAGHINFYNFRKLQLQIKMHVGQILNLYFTNVFDYFRNSKYYKNKMTTKHKLVNRIATYVFKISPKFCSFIFTDFVMILVRCY